MRFYLKTGFSCLEKNVEIHGSIECSFIITTPTITAALC